MANHPAPARTSTFQRMLALEQQGKLQRLQAAPTMSSSSTSIQVIVEPSRGTPLRASTVPCLDVSKAVAARASQPISPTACDSNTPAPSMASRSVEDPDVAGSISDRTSICRSPTWDDAARKAQRKSKQDSREKRRKEKQKAETDAKFSEKKKSRLKKPPPTNQHLDQLGSERPGRDRSASVSGLSHVDGSDTSSITCSRSAARSRRGSIEIGFKALVQATQGMRAPWRSSQSSLATEEDNPDASRSFVGGLKLQIAQEPSKGPALAEGMIVEADNSAESARRAECGEDQLVRTPITPTLHTGPAEFTKSVSAFSWIEGASVLNLDVDTQKSVRNLTVLPKMSTEPSLPASNSALKRRDAKRLSTERPWMSQATAARDGVYNNHDRATLFPSRRNSITPALKDMKTAAKAAFTRHHHIPKSSSASIIHPSSCSASTSLTPDNQSTKSSARNAIRYDGLASGDISASQLRIEGQVASPTALGSSMTSLQQPFSLSSDKIQDSASSPSNSKQSRALEDTKSWRSRSKPKTDLTGSTDLSDDSTVYHTSNVTTPLSSRPQSEWESSQEIPIDTTRQIKKASPSRPDSSNHFLSSDGLSDAHESCHSPERRNCENKKSEIASHDRKPKTSKNPVPYSRFSDGLQPGASSQNGSTEEVITSTALQRHSSASKPIITPKLHDLSFLPPLTHQPLVVPQKAKGRSAGRKHSKQESTPDPSPVTMSSSFSLPTMNRSDSVVLRSNSGQVFQEVRLQYPCEAIASPAGSRTSSSPPSSATAVSGRGEPIAKMFVVCCSCRYFHDLPSKIYACMASPDAMVRDRELGVSGIVSTTVKCPWCGHGMSTSCCAGWTGIVYLKERLH